MPNVCSFLTDVGVAIENPPRWLPYRDRPLSFESEEEYDKTKVVASYCDVAHDWFRHAVPCVATHSFTRARPAFFYIIDEQNDYNGHRSIAPLATTRDRAPLFGPLTAVALLEGPVAARDGVASTWR
ncbi:hypothetical protein MRX96_035884 [Rhipicephalus microplus]